MTNHPRLLLLAAVTACCLLRAAAQSEDTAAQSEDTAQTIEVTNTQTLDFPAGGVLHMTNAIGEITVEGWDQPGFEMTVIKSTKDVVNNALHYGKGKDRLAGKAAATKMLEDMKVNAERKGDEVLITTTAPQHSKLARPFFGLEFVYVEYRIKVPRAARINIDQYSGETHIENISGEIRAADKRGEITVREPEGEYSIDARSVFGDVHSEFPGMEKRKKLFGKSFAGALQSTTSASHSTTPQKMFLHIGYGDILILKTH